MPTTHATSLTNGEIVEENDLGSIRRGNGRRCDLSVAARVSRSPRWWVLHGQVSVVGVAVELEAFSSSDGGPAPLGGAAIAGVAEVELTDRPVRDDVLE